MRLATMLFPVLLMGQDPTFQQLQQVPQQKKLYRKKPVAGGRSLHSFAIQSLPSTEPAWIDGQFIVRLLPNNGVSVILLYIPKATVNSVAADGRTFTISIPAGMDTEVQRLSMDPRVQDVVQDSSIPNSEALTTPNDSYYTGGGAWQVDYLHMLQGWQLIPGLTSYLSSSTAQYTRPRILVADTGVDCNHADFMNLGGSSTDSALGGQLDFLNGTTSNATTAANPCAPWQDDYGHGTKTAGVAIAAGNNGVGVIGGAWMFQNVPTKITGANGLSTNSTLAGAVSNAIFLNRSLPWASRVRVVSESFGVVGTGGTIISGPARQAFAEDIILAFAGGNDGLDTGVTVYLSCIYPSLSVTCVDGGSNQCFNYGNCIQLAMPGSGVGAPVSGGGYAGVSGTSFSAPIAASLVASMWAKYPNATAPAILQQIQRTALKVGSANPTGNGWDLHYGYGVGDFQAALSGTLRSNVTYGRIVGTTLWGTSSYCCPAMVVDESTPQSQSFSTNGASMFFAPLPVGWHTVRMSGGTMPAENVYVAPGTDTYIEHQYANNPASYATYKGKVTKGGRPLPYAIVQASCAVTCSDVLSAWYAPGDWFITRVADDQGNYELSLWNGGTYNIRVSTVDGQAFTTGRIVVDGRATNNVDIVFPSADRPARITSVY